ncbi:putative late blight resistance protein homolog R1B-16 [Lactuca sativa]|uniref:Uncharacterized protein n=1 Tax=Lactuca sativa TaxID=4236 RepID=A0A9R1URV6_LACSA|nr:putative late blight resistance protein homolog R1B-16 [Lactuca sativa]KAJ0191726.1 hypothetical protein LSAT_V11C800445240 [Lactuca sativa]
MAEGFIQEDGIRSLEEIAKSYMLDLVDRNLLIVEKRYVTGDVSLCRVHDLVKQLCVEKGKEENFFLKIDSQQSNHLCDVIATRKQRRVFTNQDIDILSLSHATTPSIRSLLCYHRKTFLTDNISKFFRSFALLRVLILEKCELIDLSSGLALLVHLRYLDIWQSLFPSSICNLWNLQTLIVHTTYSCMVLPSNISNLVNLRHLISNTDIYLPSIVKPMKLEVISNVVLGDGVDNFEKCFPGIKNLTSTLYSDEENDFQVLRGLQILTLIGSAFSRRESTKPRFVRGEPNLGKNHIRFPATLKELHLVRCGLAWSDMSIIQSLPNLEVFILEDNAFKGMIWETGEEEFQQLKFLRLEELNIKHWEATSINFPCLKRLEVLNCVHLEEIPLELGDISMLEYIYVLNCGVSLLVSVQNIRQEQDDVGNYELKIFVDGRKLPSCESNHED